MTRRTAKRLGAMRIDWRVTVTAKPTVPNNIN
jgi:hypothetical protein